MNTQQFYKGYCDRLENKLRHKIGQIQRTERLLATLPDRVEATPGVPPLTDSWRAVHGARVHDPTFHVHDSTYSPTPVACDFVFASGAVVPRLRRVEVDLATKASDHQPVLVELDD